MKHLNEIVFKTKFIYGMGNINGHWDIRGIEGLKNNNNNNKILIYQKIPRNRSPRSDDMLTSNSKSISHSLAFKISYLSPPPRSVSNLLQNISRKFFESRKKELLLGTQMNRAKDHYIKCQSIWKA